MSSKQEPRWTGPATTNTVKVKSCKYRQPGTDSTFHDHKHHQGQKQRITDGQTSATSTTGAAPAKPLKNRWSNVDRRNLRLLHVPPERTKQATMATTDLVAPNAVTSTATHVLGRLFVLYNTHYITSTPVTKWLFFKANMHSKNILSLSRESRAGILLSLPSLSDYHFFTLEQSSSFGFPFILSHLIQILLFRYSLFSIFGPLSF